MSNSPVSTSKGRKAKKLSSAPEEGLDGDK